MYSPPPGVLTPDELLTAARDKAPDDGNPWTNEFAIFDAPVAINSCVASTDLPLADEQVFLI